MLAVFGKIRRVEGTERWQRSFQVVEVEKVVELLINQLFIPDSAGLTDPDRGTDRWTARQSKRKSENIIFWQASVFLSQRTTLLRLSFPSIAEVSLVQQFVESIFTLVLAGT